MKKRQAGLMVFGFLFFVLFSFGLSWAQNPPTLLIVVRASDDSLWKMTCDEGSCSAFTNFPGMFRYQPTVTWDEVAQEWVVIGTASNSSIWMATFDKQGNFNNDWQAMLGATASPAGASGAYYGILGQLNCTSGQVAKWNGSAWACEDDLSGGGTPSSTVTNLDGTSLAGTSDNYSRGDHRHGIASGAITGTMIADGAVSGAKIGDGQVTNPKITGPIDGTKISSTGLNADTVDGQHASAFALASHPHSGGDITSGTVAEARIDSLIARGSEVSSLISTHAANVSAHHTRYTDAEAVAAIKATDGSGSGLDADLLDGQDSAYYLSLANQTGVLPILKGGTGSSTQNFVDLSSPQTVGGAKTFSDQIISSVSTGAAPMQVSSTTLVTNLNSELHGGYRIADLDTRYGQASPVQNPRSNTLTMTDPVGFVGYQISITIGTDGLPVISYYDFGNMGLKVAKCGNSACSSGNTITAIDSAGDVGWYTSITIGTDGLPAISYFDGTNGGLKVAKCANPFCLNNWSRR